jgi:hypothetical protein
MTILKRLIDLLEKFQSINNIDTDKLVKELQNALNYFKQKENEKFNAEYVDKPWF